LGFLVGKAFAFIWAFAFGFWTFWLFDMGGFGRENEC
jgi:hypothetical protein